MFTADPTMKMKVHGSRVGAWCVGVALLFAAQISSAPGSGPTISAGDDTLAVVGKRVITSRMFGRLYKDKLLRMGLSDNGEMRTGYLKNLVDDELMIAHARRLGLAQTGEAKAEMDRIKVQQLLNAYTERHIEPTAKVTDKDLRDLFVRMNTKVNVRHLYAPTRESADSLYTRLRGGESFEELARAVFTDPQLRNNGGSLGYISFDEMDPDFENAAFSMNVGEISKPVKTVQGYSIIRVDDRFQNPLITEYEFARAKERLRAFAKKTKFEETAKRFTATLRSRLDIRLNKELVRRLYGMGRSGSWQMVIEQPSGTWSAADLKRVAVTTRDGTWSLKELIGVLSATAERQRGWVHTEENFEDYIAGLVMRNWIARQAKLERLDAVPGFRQKVDYAFDTFLEQNLEKQIKDKMVFAPDSLQAYYAKNRDNYAIPPEVRLSSILLEEPWMSDSVKQMLVEGRPFEELSRRYSVQRATAKDGGDMGYFTRKELGNYGNEIFALHIGAWTGPLGEEGKYLFVKCTDRKAISYRSFGECREDIDKALREETWYRMKDSYVEALKRETPCRVYPARVNTLVFSSSN